MPLYTGYLAPGAGRSNQGQRVSARNMANEHYGHQDPRVYFFDPSVYASQYVQAHHSPLRRSPRDPGADPPMGSPPTNDTYLMDTHHHINPQNYLHSDNSNRIAVWDHHIDAGEPSHHEYVSPLALNVTVTNIQGQQDISGHGIGAVRHWPGAYARWDPPQGFIPLVLPPSQDIRSLVSVDRHAQQTVDMTEPPVYLYQPSPRNAVFNHFSHDNTREAFFVDGAHVGT